MVLVSLSLKASGLMILRISKGPMNMGAGLHLEWKVSARPSGPYGTLEPEYSGGWQKLHIDPRHKGRWREPLPRSAYTCKQRRVPMGKPPPSHLEATEEADSRRQTGRERAGGWVRQGIVRILHLQQLIRTGARAL